MKVSDILMALWEIEPKREIDKIDISGGEIVFSDGEVMTIEYGIKRYKCEILGESYASDPETYPESVRKAFEYYDRICTEFPDEDQANVANNAANMYGENYDDYNFIWDCFRATYPEFQAQEFLIPEPDEV